MMPLSEFHSATKGKRDSSHQKMTHCSSGLSPSVPEGEFVELLWENGHVIMQGQSNRPKKSSFPSAFPNLAGKAKEKEVRDAVTPKAGRHGATDSVGNDLQTTEPSGQGGLNGQDDELVPWLSYPIDDYCSEFLSEFPGFNLNSASASVLADRIVSFGQAARDTHGLENVNGSRVPAVSSELGRANNSQLSHLPHECQTFSQSSRPRESEMTLGTAYQGPNGDLPTTKMQKQELTTSKPMQPNNSTPLMNFSHFTRPVALVKANLLSVDRLRGSEKASTAASSNPMESTRIESAGGLKGVVSVFNGHLAPVTPKADSNPPVQPSQEIVFVEHSGAICPEDAAKNSRKHNKPDTMNNPRSTDHMKCQDSNFKAIGKHEVDKHHEPVIASSSVCSANATSATSNDIKNRAKSKCQEGEESEYHSEDHEDDLTGIRKSVIGQSTSKKRSRAAEVHNLSERRRRDRINEKMRALQELIPNCNKVDKASMLDEAIEYLKTLQMQVQIMSMGTGLCMPPLMLPAGMQHIRMPHISPFSPMGVGMGMGMGLGFGMGMLDMTASPLMPLPRMHGPQYPCASIPGTAGLHGMPGSSNLQMFGVPGQALPMSMPHPSPFIPSMGMPANMNPVPEAPAAEVSQVQAPDSTPPSANDQQLNSREQVAKTTTDSTPVESSRQTNKECFDLPSVIQIDNQPSNVGGCEVINSGSGIHLTP